MTIEAREASRGLGVHHPKKTPDRMLVPEATHTQIFGNGVGPKSCPGVTEEWYFNPNTRTYESVADRTNGSK